MSLQRRLTLVFSLIVILPLAVAGFAVHRVVVGELESRAQESLAPALNATVAVYNDRVEALDERVRATVGFTRFARLLRNGTTERMDDFLRVRLLDATGLDFLIALDAEGRRVGYAASDAEFVSIFEQPGPDEILEHDSGVGPGFNRTPQLPVQVVGRGLVGAVVGGFWMDRSVLTTSIQDDVELSMVRGGRVIATTLEDQGPPNVEPEFGVAFETNLGGGSIAEARDLSGGLALVASTPEAPLIARERQVAAWMLALLVLAGAATALLARHLARLTTEDLEELAQGASAISEGRLDVKIPVRSKDEIGQLATRFNEMTDRLRVTITELQASRDQLQTSIRRVGEALRSTHDMRQLLDAILNTAADAVSADAASLWRFTPTRDELYPWIGRNVDVDELKRVRVGEGIVGHVAERGVMVTLPSAEGGARPAPAEPNLPVTVALPLYAADRIVAVLSLYRRDAAHRFTLEDVNRVQFLAETGQVALENVSLHEEARRLSLTDGLTGVWNRRYLQMQFRQVLATAVRFERPFSVLMLDLDHFKEVNDSFGHQRGDAVLIEFSQRVDRVLREVDTFSRYGGEEFVCLLPETNVEGALTTAEKIVESIRNDIFGGSGEAPVNLTVSIGVAGYPSHGDSWRQLIDAADTALYKAKQEGRDRVCVADEPTTSLKIAK